MPRTYAAARPHGLTFRSHRYFTHCIYAYRHAETRAKSRVAMRDFILRLPFAFSGPVQQPNSSSDSYSAVIKADRLHRMNQRRNVAQRPRCR